MPAEKRAKVEKSSVVRVAKESAATPSTTETLMGLSALSVEQQVKLWIATFIDPESTKQFPLLYADGANTLQAVPLCTFSRDVPDWPQTGPSNYSGNHRLGPTVQGAGANITITDQSGQPMQLLNELCDEVTQQAIYESKNSAGLDCPYSWTSPGGGKSFCIPITHSTVSAGNVTNVAGQSPYKIMPWNCIYDSTIPGKIMNSTFCKTPLAAANQNPPSAAFHGNVLPIGTANQNRYVHIDTTAQAYNQPPADAGVVAANAAVAGGSSSACIFIVAGSITVPGENGLAAWYPGDQYTINLYQFNENEEGDPTYTFQNRIPGGSSGATNPPNTPLAEDTPICLLPIWWSDKWRIEITANYDVTYTPQATGSKRSIKIMHTSCGGIMQHRMAPDINEDWYTLGLFTASRLTASMLKVPNFTILASKGGKACVLQLQPGDYDSATFGQDAGNPYTTMASQQDETVDVLERGEKLYLTPVGSERMHWKNNIDNPSSKSKLPTNYAAAAPFNVTYELINRNIVGQVLLSPGVGATTSTVGTTTTTVSQNAAQNLELIRWTRFEVQSARQILSRRYPVGTPAIYDAAALRVAHMKRAGPANSPLGYFLASEGYRERLNYSMM